MRAQEGSRPARDPQGAPAFALRVRMATLFGAGRFPIAPGTVGSALTLPLAALLAWCGPWVYLAGTVAIVAIAIWAAEPAERHFGIKDPSAVVIDETAGQLVTLAFVPLTLGWFAAGFFLFRVFDIIKPFPGRRLERLPGGAGIVLDDVAVGVYGCILLHAARFVGRELFG